MWQDYRDSWIEAGASAEEAEAKTVVRREAVVPGGALPKDHYALAVVSEGRAVGRTWLAERAHGDWYCYELDIDAEHRGKGLGAAAVAEIERYVRARGAMRIECSVFGFNTAMSAMLAAGGFEVVSVTMAKRLG